METEASFRNMLNHVFEGIYFVDANRKITFWNQGAERITGFCAEEVIGKHCFSNLLNHVDDDGNKLCIVGCPLHATIQDGRDRDNKIYLQHKEGHRVTVRVHTTPLIENGAIIGAIEIFVEESSQFANLFELGELREIAYRDQMTELPNRRYLDHHLAAQLSLSEKLDSTFAVLMIDIDHFKAVNDTYGHLVGDETIKMVAKTLHNGLRSADIVGRWGGEEFVSILTGVTPEALAKVCEKLRLLVENSGLLRDEENIRVTVSIGATFVIKGESVETLLGRADKLLYSSKHTGRNKVTIG